jgi:amicoumacin kinase
MEPAVAQLYRPEHLAEAAAGWGVDHKSARALGDFENYVYEVRHQGRPAVLRLSHSSHRTADQVRGELDFIDHLARGGVGVCPAIAGAGGERVRVVPADDGSFVAVLFEHAAGRRVRRRDPHDWNEGLFRVWGATAGRMHRLAGTHVAPSIALRRRAWQDDDLLRDARRYVPTDEPFVHERLAEVTTWLAALPGDRDSYGLTHGDLHHGNFFLDGQRLVVFDFDDAAYHWFAHDIAVSLYHVYPPDGAEPTEWESFARRFLDVYLAGYRSEHPIADEWLGRLPGFLRFRDLIMYVNFCKKHDSQVLEPWRQRFREALRTRIRLGQPLLDPG